MFTQRPARRWIRSVVPSLRTLPRSGPSPPKPSIADFSISLPPDGFSVRSAQPAVRRPCRRCCRCRSRTAACQDCSAWNFRWRGRFAALFSLNFSSVSSCSERPNHKVCRRSGRGSLHQLCRYGGSQAVDVHRITGGKMDDVAQRLGGHSRVDTAQGGFILEMDIGAPGD